MKYESVTFFTKEQRQECAQALIARDKALRIFYYRSFKESQSASSSKALLRSPTLANSTISNGEIDMQTDEFSDNKYTFS